jgi:RHS repeat-associated protein
LLDVNSDGSFVKYVNGLGIDDKIRQTVNGQVLYFVQDHLGSTNALTDATGNVISSVTYDSFGNSTGNLATRYQYTGREKDAETGLHYYRARWYDSNLGRFLGEDPIGFAGDDINLYGYVWSSPINKTDSSGLFPSQKRFYHHQNIIRHVFKGLATDKQIEIMAQEQYDFDASTQDEPYAPMHAMARIGQSSQSARDEANMFIRNEICTARNLTRLGFESEGLRRLSRAIHTLQDSTSPAHYDFQEAWNDSPVWHLDHYISESLVFPRKAQLARRQTVMAWLYYKGEAEMPNDFFINHLYDSGYGPSFSPSTTSSSKGGNNCGCY